MEKRKSYRVLARDEFLVEFRPEKKKRFWTGHGCDFSLRSIRFATGHRIARGTNLKIRIYFPSGFQGRKRIQGVGKVIRVYRPAGARYYRAACEFSALSERTRETFYQFFCWVETRKQGSES